MSDFPAELIDKQDARYYGIKHEDPGMTTPTDGGHVLSRPRYTRRPRRIFTTGCTNITDTQRLLLEALWNDNRGTSQAFNWTDPVSGSVILVRFVKPIDFTYAGIGATIRWNAKMEFREV